MRNDANRGLATFSKTHVMLLFVALMAPALFEVTAYHFALVVTSDSAPAFIDAKISEIVWSERNPSVRRCSDDKYWLAKKRIVVITTMFSDFEKTLKNFTGQTLPFDAIAFADRPLQHPDWQVDTYPWHYNNSQSTSLQWNCSLRNSFCNNNHPYLIYKYYKTQFHRIKGLEKYDLVLWLDGRMLVNSSRFLDDWCTQLVLEQPGSPLMAFDHNCTMSWAVKSCAKDYHWRSEWLFDRKQPKQPLGEQVEFYRGRGYRDDWYKNLTNRRHDASYWRSGLILWDMRHPLATRVLDRWWEEILTWSTQCQLSLAYLSWEFGIQWATWNLGGRRPWPIVLLKHGE